MAIKKISLLLACIISLDLYFLGQDLFPLVRDIGLIGDESSKDFAPPDKLIIGVEVSRDALYKFSDEENVIKAGLFTRGLNTVEIEANGLFLESGTHVYFLDLKAGDLTLRKEIEIDIQLDSSGVDSGTPPQVKNPEPEPEYELSMFVGEKLMVSGRKSLSKELSFNVELPPLPDGYGPFYEIEKEYKNPLRNSFSILDAIGAGYSLIKNMIDKKKMQKQVKPVQKHEQLTATFMRRDSEGAAREVTAVIKLKVKNGIL
ncbi:MAG: hypothetical protein OEY25_13455 [Candidatus Aminicenantes bacterium]|nr:hypothetical protein [Candidatus Aminicenantes bacterium]MDH5706893.1 hypothetical protein [Candidatus Aminicenantes bacterium]